VDDAQLICGIFSYYYLHRKGAAKEDEVPFLVILGYLKGRRSNILREIKDAMSIQ
jgi:hypothetical protein